jgi:hypothetical protein
MKNPDYLYYCNDCAAEKGYPRTQNIQTTECDICGITCFANMKEARALTIHVKPEKVINDDYFNTTGMEGDDLKKVTRKATKQSDIIFDYFKKNRRQAISPTEIWRNCFDVDSVPLTSIRRAISVLTRKGKLIKTNIQCQGMFGRPEYKWRYKM